MKLFPFKKEERHKHTHVDKSVWQDTQEDDIEIHVFSNAFFLVEVDS